MRIVRFKPETLRLLEIANNYNIGKTLNYIEITNSEYEIIKSDLGGAIMSMGDNNYLLYKLVNLRVVKD
jgi:hypothetical protein